MNENDCYVVLKTEPEIRMKKASYDTHIGQPNVRSESLDRITTQAQLEPMASSQEIPAAVKPVIVEDPNVIKQKSNYLKRKGTIDKSRFAVKKHRDFQDNISSR